MEVKNARGTVEDLRYNNQQRYVLLADYSSIRRTSAMWSWLKINFDAPTTQPHTMTAGPPVVCNYIGHKHLRFKELLTLTNP
jgi:hypothetical protein